MDVCSACGGDVLFMDSNVFIALCRPVMSILCKQSRLNWTFEQEKEIIG